MPRIVESRFKQAAEAKKNKTVGPDESVAAAKAKTKRKLTTTAANESTFSASRLGCPLTSSTPAPRKIASKIAPKEKISKNVSKSINNTTVKSDDRKVNEKLRAESARAKAEERAEQLTNLIEKAKINQLAARKIKLTKIHTDIGKDEHITYFKKNGMNHAARFMTCEQKKVKERIAKLESEMEKHLKKTCDAEAFFELKVERKTKLQELEAIMPHFDEIMVRLNEASPYIPIIQNSMIIELGKTSEKDFLSDLSKLEESLVRLFNTKSEDEILEDLENMEKVKLADIRIQELKSLQENLQKEINRMKEEIDVFNYDPLAQTVERIMQPL